MKAYKRRKLTKDIPVEVYRNLHRGGYSVRQNGRVIGHTNELILMDAEFVVQEGGRQRVLRTGVKNVHAWVRGYVTPGSQDGWNDPLRHHIHYNPIAAGHFWWSELSNSPFEGAVYNARLVLFKKSGVTAWRINDW